MIAPASRGFAEVMMIVILFLLLFSLPPTESNQVYFVFDPVVILRTALSQPIDELILKVVDVLDRLEDDVQVGHVLFPLDRRQDSFQSPEFRFRVAVPVNGMLQGSTQNILVVVAAAAAVAVVEVVLGVGGSNVGR